MRSAIGLAFVAALGAGACKKTGRTPEPTGAGSAPVASTGSAVAPVDPKAALDAALKKQGIADKDVTKRVNGPHSAWALIVSKSRDDGFYVTEYTIVRAGEEGVAELPIPAHAGGTDPSLNKDVNTFDVRDLDGDGRDECIAVLEWQRSFTFPYAKGCKHCEYGEGEGGKQLYVIRDKGAALDVAFTHMVEYTTLSQPSTADDPDPPEAEKVAYEWKIDGSPPVASFMRTDDDLNPKRPKDLLDPASDPLFAAGSGAAVPLVLK
jgi:hypothetical protein